jgi:hypothetical protein
VNALACSILTAPRFPHRDATWTITGTVLPLIITGMREAVRSTGSWNHHHAVSLDCEEWQRPDPATLVWHSTGYAGGTLAQLSYHPLK